MAEKEILNGSKKNSKKEKTFLRKIKSEQKVYVYKKKLILIKYNYFKRGAD